MKKALGLALTLIATSALAQEAMTGDELEDLLGKDKSFVLGGPGTGYAGEVVFRSDGTTSGSVKTDDGKVTEIGGVWYIVGNKVCRTWKDVDEGKEVCGTWIKDGDNKARVLVDGKVLGVSW